MSGYFWDHYETTARMSSYLVAFLVSEFVAVSPATAHQVPFRVWVNSEFQHLTE